MKYFGLDNNFSIASEENITKNSKEAYDSKKAIIDENFKNGYGYLGMVKKEVKNILKNDIAPSLKGNYPYYFNIFLSQFDNFLVRGNLKGNPLNKNPEQISMRSKGLFIDEYSLYVIYAGMYLKFY